MSKINIWACWQKYYLNIEDNYRRKGTYFTRDPDDIFLNLFILLMLKQFDNTFLHRSKALITMAFKTLTTKIEINTGVHLYIMSVKIIEMMLWLFWFVMAHFIKTNTSICRMQRRSYWYCKSSFRDELKYIDVVYMYIHRIHCIDPNFPT